MWTNSAFERVLETPEKKDKFYKSYDANNELLDILAEAFKEKVKNCDDVVKSTDTYKDPSWAYRQADSNGYKRALTEVIHLMTIREIKE